MNEELKKLFLKYEELKIEEKKLKAEVDTTYAALKPHLNEDMGKLEAKHGNFTVITMPRFEYSDHVKIMKDQLKEAEMNERATGEARQVDNLIVLKYTQAKA